MSNWAKSTNSIIRLYISSWLRFISRSVPNFSTQNEAIADPLITALFMFSNEISSVLARYPINPPAKVSPAPVGSNTYSSGNAGAKKTWCSSLNNKAPCSPFLIIRYFGPIFIMVLAAFTNEYSFDNWRASSSLMIKTSINFNISFKLFYWW